MKKLLVATLTIAVAIPLKAQSLLMPSECEVNCLCLPASDIKQVSNAIKDLELCKQELDTRPLKVVEWEYDGIIISVGIGAVAGLVIANQVLKKK